MEKIKIKKQKKQQEQSLINNDQLINLQSSWDSSTFLNSETQRAIVKERLISLDIFRGMTMVGMILVDDGSDINNNQRNIWPIKHSEWNGWTTADQIFPNFLFIMGMAIPFAIQYSDRNKGQTWRKLFVRSFLLVFLGLIITFQQQLPEMYQTQPFQLHFRLPGILQRLGICYFVVASVYLAFESLQIQWAIYLISTFIYIGLQYGLNVPDYTQNDKDGITHSYTCGRGMVDSEACNAGAYIDRQVFGNGRFAWLPGDPEGLLGFLNSFTNTFLGMYFTLIMKQLKSDKTKLLQTWLILSLILTSTGLFINEWIPLNKKQWSPSFMIFTSGFSGLTLTFCFYLLDMVNSSVMKKLAAPFQWLGMNPLFIYVLVMLEATLLQNNLPKEGERSIFDWFAYQAFYTLFRNDYIANACNSLFYLILWTLLAYILFRKNIFIKL